MAYPMLPFPTWGEFLEKLGQLGVRVRNTGIKIPISGTMRHLEVLEHAKDGKMHSAPLQPHFLNQIVQPEVMRSILRQLHIDPKQFGFELDELEE